MSLQFDVEEFICLLVSAIFECSDEDTEIDTESTTVIDESQEGDSDVEGKTCYREAPVYTPQLVAG